MPLHNDFTSAAAFRDGYVAIGNFDGVHRGHREIVAKLVERAQAAGTAAVVLTFNPHPVRLLRPEQAPPNLTTLPQKTAILEAGGVDAVIAFPTTREFLSHTAEEFFQQIVVDRLHARGLVEGANFRFGKGRAGDVESLARMCAANGLTLDVVPPVIVDGETVSSSRIRNHIAAGRIDEAVQLLGHAYSLQGTVVRGVGRGASLGFPTANLDAVETLLPADGVYAGRMRLNGDVRPAAVHRGANPTFADGQRKLEIHVIGHTGDLYGRELTVDLLSRIRDVVRFDNADDLRRQLESDVAATIRIAGSQGPDERSSRG
jgi:riboflavin kinase / FMN adenylyltransferase